MGSLERSKKKVQLWKKAIVHFSLCFIMGFFTGFAPTGKSSIFSNEVAISNKPLEFSPPPVEVLNPEKTQNFTTRELEETAISTAPEESRDAGNLKNPKEETINNGELNPRRLVIIVTPTSKTDRLRGVLLRRLANTLKLVAQPLLWIVVEQFSDSAEVLEILRNTGIMYRHVVFKENFTDIHAEMDHQRNLALNHIEHHRLNGIVHFASLSNNILKFVKKEVLEEDTKLKGIPQEGCSKVLLWNLYIFKS
ncbi:probable beta-1,4-xylosyltransferase IRX9 [Olea europaea subsp. europaea]|uniref:Glycosyltransferases n=1 Tax=Olea europaea subsp. europaea TaxID=158383 RepID=A0A8S0R0X3_OLEEU|nr:probable beta-1,4-xylosyltransferase IRX9 [Olea europaea subsp. europaea]